MRTVEINRINAVDAVRATLNKYSTVYNANPVVVAAVSELASMETQIHSEDQIQKQGTTSITNTKNVDKENMINLTFAHAQAGLAYASNANNTSLQTSFSISISSLKKSDEAELIDKCQNIHDLANTYIGSLTNYGATSATVTALQTAINAFSGIKGQPRAQKSAIKTATSTIAEVLKQIHTFYKNILDPLIEQYKTSNAAFYSEYHTSRLIVDSGSHKETIIEGVVTDSANNPLANVLVKMTNTKKKKLTKANGKFRFMKLQPIKYTVTATAQGYVAFSENVVLTKDEANKITIVMLPAKGGIVVQ
jgi:hypothetical protein